MNKSIIGYIYLAATILTTVFSQLIIKWRVTGKFIYLPLPQEITGKIVYLFSVIFDPFIFMGLCATFISGLCWMATMTKFEISYAYPFTMLGFILVLLLSVLLLGETLNIYKIVGSLVAIVGVFIASKGM